MIEARGLTKKYGDLTAVDGIDFSIRAGECYGFL
ncbi:MAG: ABC transporter, partial [Acidobacteria bacterium]